jgi:alpha-tubulin suppressor-like RCC1 family protein
MSDVSVDIIKNRSGEAPDLPSGANLSGVSTAATLQVTNLNPTHINASGVTTATTFSGSLLSTGTPTLGLGVTINSSGLNISGVATAGIVSATTLYGDGSNLTGVAMSIAPISYNPDVNDSVITTTSGIGITFTELIKAGSGNVTLSIATNAGAAGTTVENFGVGSSVTINHNTVSISPSSNLNNSETYHISYPSGAFTNTAGDVSYVGTAYTFGTKELIYEMWLWGNNQYGQLGQNQAPGNLAKTSSPVQLPGTTWSQLTMTQNNGALAIRTDGTLWSWGFGVNGQLGQNSTIEYSSPVQVPGTTWSNIFAGKTTVFAIKTDGTLWSWGYNEYGALGQNDRIYYSSPVQIPGTTWSKDRKKMSASPRGVAAIKTDGTLWTWGTNNSGHLGLNQTSTRYSSPVQVPGTTWSEVQMYNTTTGALKTDGTLWAWGTNWHGGLGQNDRTQYSSPVQVPGTNWSAVFNNQGSNPGLAGLKTDGTLWSWGYNESGALGLNQSQGTQLAVSSPTQIPGTTWTSNTSNWGYGMSAVKTDGSLWTWGLNGPGALGQNNRVNYSSPTQVPGTWSTPQFTKAMVVAVIKEA